MNKKEIREIRRRIRPEHNNIQHLYGCYVNSAKEIIARLDESVGLLSAEEQEKYVSLLKKTLSGSLGKNLMGIDFSTRQVADSDEHRLLSALRRTELKDPVIREQFYQCVVNALDMGDSNYLLLVAFDSYDVPHSDREHEEEDREVFSYVICSVCPVKTVKPVLSYSNEENRFRNLSLSQIVAAPELGFLFPAFDDRAANIYSALFYSRDTKGTHGDFIDAVFKTEVPMSPLQQKEAFGAVVRTTLNEDCSFEVVRDINSRLRERIELHKESRDPDALVLSPDEVEEILEDSGMDAGHREAFLQHCTEEFGEKAGISPENVINSKQFRIETESAKITVDPEFSSLVRTETIDGRKYLLIPVDGMLEVNGIDVAL